MMIGQCDNARAVLVALVAATGASAAGQALCAALLDQAAELLRSGPADVIAAVGGSAEPVARRAGLRMISEICGQCRLCPRGQGQPDPSGPGGLGPIGAQKWRKR